MANTYKGELLVYLDIGLVGTFVGLRQSETEKGYVHVEYVPLMTHPFKIPKKMLLPRPIPEDNIHFTSAKRMDIPGVEGRVVYIHTGEEGSIVKDFIDQELLRKNEEQAEEIRRLRMGIASSRQESEDARSGVSKTIASMKNATKQSRYDDFNTTIGFPPPPIRRDRDRDMSGFEEF